LKNNKSELMNLETELAENDVILVVIPNKTDFEGNCFAHTLSLKKLFVSQTDGIGGLGMRWEKGRNFYLRIFLISAMI